MNISDPMLTDVELGNVIRRGIELVKSVFELRLPNLSEESLGRIISPQNQFENADFFFERLSDEILKAQDLERTTDDYIALNASVGLPSIDLEQIGRDAIERDALADEDLINVTNSRFQINKTDLIANFEVKKNYAWLKINHGWWELVASHALEMHGLEHSFFRHRPFYEDSRCCDLIAKSIQLLQARANSIAPNFITDDTALAISFNAGHLWNSDIVTPLPSFIRGAMIGASSYFYAAVGGPYPIAVGDGAEAKKLAYERQLAEFCSLVSAWSEAIVFITPDHLKTITLVDFIGDTFHVVVPARRIHELWPSTLAYVAGSVERIISDYSTVTLFIQAAVISAPIGALLVDLMRRRSGVRIYDFGQVLDLAEPVGRRTKKWARDLEDYPQFADAHVGAFTFRR